MSSPPSLSRSPTKIIISFCVHFAGVIARFAEKKLVLAHIDKIKETKRGITANKPLPEHDEPVPSLTIQKDEL